jgi:hypothetical protein
MRHSSRVAVLLAALGPLCAIAQEPRPQVAPAAQDKDKPPARRIPTKDFKVNFPEQPTGAMNPEVIASADELAKSPVLKDAADDLKKQIDFKKEKLLIFAWSGKPKDVVGPTATTIEGKKTTVVFTYTPGATKGTRNRIYLYTVSRDAEVKVERGKAPK